MVHNDTKGQLKTEAEQALAKRRSLTGEVQHPTVAAANANANANEGKDASDSAKNQATRGNPTGVSSSGGNPSKVVNMAASTSRSSISGFVAPDFGALLNKKDDTANEQGTTYKSVC